VDVRSVGVEVSTEEVSGVFAKQLVTWLAG
jgi:hypothetical protein